MPPTHLARTVVAPGRAQDPADGTKGNEHMSGSKVRLQAIDAVKGCTPPPAAFFPPPEAPGEIFGQNVFSKKVMQQRLPKATFKALMGTVEHGKPLDPGR